MNSLKKGNKTGNKEMHTVVQIPDSMGWLTQNRKQEKCQNTPKCIV